MKAIFYNASRYLDIIPLKLLINVSRQKVIFPFYHLVSDAEIIHIKHLYNVRKIKEFERDLDFFLREYNPLDVCELMSSMKMGHKMKKKGFLLSFDDGLREFNDIIAPILLKKGIPAICFLNSAFIDNNDLFYRYKISILIERLSKQQLSDSLKKYIKAWVIEKNMPFDESGKFLLSINYLNRHYLDELANILDFDFQIYLKKYLPYLTSDQVSSLLKQGFSFGAHSVDHPQYSDLSINQQLHQTTQSINEIANKFNLEYKLFSFPFTDYHISNQFFNTIFSKNQNLADLTFGSAGLKKDECKRNIQRIPIEIGSFSAKEIIYGEYIYFLFKSLLYKNVIKR